MEIISNYIELHYYLKQHGHAIDAKTLNKAEAEVLKIIEDVAEQLDIPVQTNILPRKEGGLEAFYEFITQPKNAAAFAAVATPAAVFFGKIISKVLSDVIADWIKTDKEMADLKKDQLRLQNQEIKKRLEAMEVNELESPEVQKDLDKLAINLAESNKVKIAKSNFYKRLSSEDKVIKFSTRVVNSDLEPLSQENAVPRLDFKKFIIDEAKIEPNYENDKEIPIVSPVLKNSKAYWRGVIKEKEKTFAMKDKRFQRDVVSRKYSFENGSILVCDLETKLSIDQEGNIKEKGYAVYNVTQVIYPTGEIIDVIYED
jgi:hypothetical protein